MGHNFRQNGVTAHRGNPRDFPENTLAGFLDGIICGADWVETDVLVTRDGIPVLCHDATTGRTADGDLRISESTLAELKELDFSHSFRTFRGLDLQSCPRTSIPTLSEALELFAWHRDVRFSIQLKANGIASCVADVVRHWGMEVQVGFNEGSLDRLLDIRKFLPGVYVFYDVYDKNTPVEDYIGICLEHGFQELVMHHAGISPEKCEKIRAAGIVPGAWNVGDEGLMRRMLDSGVYRLYCDAPRVHLGLLEEMRKSDGQ